MRQLTAFLILQLSFASATVVADTTRTIMGEEVPIGNGTVRTWLKINERTGVPESIGVTMTEGGLYGLPEDADPPQKGSLKLKLIDGSPHHTFEYGLHFPEEAEMTAFNHMGYNWNPEGHGPLPGVFFEPHYDVHFYMASLEYRHAIKNDDLTDLKVLNLEPPKEFLPPRYERAPSTSEPRMGTHYADMSSDQLKPGNFTNIFLIGVHDGSIIFWEPMITREYLLTKPNFHADIPQPEAYPVSGYYPTAYSVVYDEKHKEFDISLDGLKLRVASYPGNVYSVDACLDSRLVKIIFKYAHEKPNHLTVPKGCEELIPLIDEFKSRQSKL